MTIKAVVLDVGNVLIEWDPRRLYRTLFDDPQAMERFLTDVCTRAWLDTMDRGTSFDEAVATLTERFPEHAAEIAAYRDRWFDTLGDVIDGSVQILRELRRAGVPVYGLTNFSREMWPRSVERYPFLGEFDDVVVSAHEQLSKPDLRIYARLTERLGLEPATVFFADDRADNVAAAVEAGWDAVQFTTPQALREALQRRGLLPA